MNREDLEALFCMKISAELEMFQMQMLKKAPEEIYGNVYLIDSMINFYEVLAEKAEYLDAGQLESLFAIPNLLKYFYDRWLDYEDHHVQDINECMTQAIREIGKRAGKERAFYEKVNINRRIRA